MEPGIAARSQTMHILCETLRRGIDKGRFSDMDVELTAQILWTSAFGLTVKLILEKNLPAGQMDRLLDQHFNVVFNGILTRKEGNE